MRWMLRIDVDLTDVNESCSELIRILRQIYSNCSLNFSFLSFHALPINITKPSQTPQP